MAKELNDKYLRSNRLADVVRLIVVLAVDENSFRSEAGLQGVLRGLPNSEVSWLTLAAEHLEFFRFNKDNSKIVLLIRFIQKVNVEEGEQREPLSVDQTQKLVDQAISLHDRQLARYQRDSYRISLQSAFIGAIGGIIVALITVISSSLLSTDVKSDIKSIKESIKIIQSQKSKI